MVGPAVGQGVVWSSVVGPAVGQGVVWSVGASVGQGVLGAVKVTAIRKIFHILSLMKVELKWSDGETLLHIKAADAVTDNMSRQA